VAGKPPWACYFALLRAASARERTQPHLQPERLGYRRIQGCALSSVWDLVVARCRFPCFGTDAEAKAPPSDLITGGLPSAVSGIFPAMDWSMNALCCEN
jgi:hypothetical protein